MPQPRFRLPAASGKRFRKAEERKRAVAPQAAGRPAPPSRSPLPLGAERGGNYLSRPQWSLECASRSRLPHPTPGRAGRGLRGVFAGRAGSA